MRFWDSSALLPLLVAETSTSAALARIAPSALARLEREGALTERIATIAFER